MDKVYRLEVTDKVIIVTGGYGYLGKAIVFGLAAHGARVHVMGRYRDKFDKAFARVFNKINFLEGDVSDSKSIANAFAKVVDQENRIDVLINNAFYSKGKSPEFMTDEEWSIGIDGTIGNVFRCIREVIPIMKIHRSGRIINVSSIYGLVAPDFQIYDDSPDFLNPPHYGAAKAGILQLTRYYASYLGKDGITVNCVTPGAFPSDEVQGDEEFIKKLASKTVLRRIGKPEDLAGAFVFLASAGANYITGQNIVIDGGWTIR